jgi:hypothetical protein
MGGTNGLKKTTLGVNVFTAPGKAMVGERPKPFGEAFGFDPITSTLIFGEYDAVLVDAMTTVAEAEALSRKCCADPLNPHEKSDKCPGGSKGIIPPGSQTADFTEVKLTA